MADSRLLRVPISGAPDAFYILQVLSNGSSLLDLKLLGTEGDYSYTTKFRQRRINEFKAPNGHCTDEEWEQILISTLIHPDGPHAGDVEVKADIKADAEDDNQPGYVTLRFRKNIQGIKQRLGSIQLQRTFNKEDEIQPFDWCVDIIGSKVKVAEDLAAATAKIDELQEITKDLRAQLEEFITTKEDDERQLFEKFRDLLNQKKMRIRAQERLIVSADIDPIKMENVGASQGAVRKVMASGAAKRKATQEPFDESDGFEEMEIDEAVDVKDEPETDQDMGETTGADTDSDDAPVQAVVSRRSRAPGSSQTKGASKAASAKGDGDDFTLPPRRELPFNSKGNKPSTPAPKAIAGDETDSDDEL